MQPHAKSNPNPRTISMSLKTIAINRPGAAQKEATSSKIANLATLAKGGGFIGV